MAIIYDREQGLLTLHTLHSTYQMGISSYGHLLHLYYGRRAEGSFLPLLSLRDRGFSGNPYDAGNDRSYSADTLPQELSAFGNGDYRHSGFRLRTADGACGSDLRFEEARRYPGKYRLPGGLPAADAFRTEGEESGAESLELRLRDSRSGTLVRLLYAVYEEEDILTRAVIVENAGAEPVWIEQADSAALDFPRGHFDLVHFSGSYGNERLYHRERLSAGEKSIGSSRGASSHQHNPFVMLCTADSTEDSGEVYGLALVYSGNFRISAEVDQLGQTRLSAGMMDTHFSWRLGSGEQFCCPEAVLGFGEGFAVLSQRFHRFTSRHILHGTFMKARRPVLLNSWEGCYFDFDGTRILRLAEEAKELGIELIVMDDGWFGKRDNDLSGLGDWQCNTKKLGMPLGVLAEGIRERGLRFGIWIEPEMVSEDSALFREHPDYAFRIPGKEPIRSRMQLVLDFSRQEVVDRIFRDLSETLREAKPDYIKMDMNRSIMEAYTHAQPAAGESCADGTMQNRGALLHRYMLGVYDFLRRMQAAFPETLIEGCCGGGGRFDLGMLYFTPQIWLSDNTDAIERLSLQYGASFGYPISAVGAHVSAVPNHQTGRSTPLATRAVAALSGSFGYELDPAALSPGERAEIRQQIEIYKRYYVLLHEGDYYRLSGAAMGCAAAGFGSDGNMGSDSFSAWLTVSSDQTEALLSVVTRTQHCNTPAEYIRLRGLRRGREYRIAPVMQSAEWYLPKEKEALLFHRFTGDVLMERGIPLPLLPGEYQSLLLHLREV